MKTESSLPSADEGVIKFHVTLESGEVDLPAAASDLEAWRHVLWRQKLIGVEKGLAEIGYGNLSMRVGDDTDQPQFLITATQTGHKSALTAADYVHVITCDLSRNTVRAYGQARPSSESLAHHIIYRLCPDAGFVFHVHSPLLWSHAGTLGLPCTPADVAYGTPAMATAIAALFHETDLATSRILSMSGHKDGIIAFGPTADAAGTTLIQTLVRALAIQTPLT